jgi:hypothetical protein
MLTLYTFSVSGLLPGHGVTLALFDGAGSRFTYQKDGIDQAIVVDDSGNAAVTMMPGRDLGGAVPGAWKVVFFEEETGYSVTIPFDIAAAVG